MNNHLNLKKLFRWKQNVAIFEIKCALKNSNKRNMSTCKHRIFSVKKGIKLIDKSYFIHLLVIYLYFLGVFETFIF